MSNIQPSSPNTKINVSDFNATCCNNRTVFRLLTAAEKRSRYLKRLFHIRHMDFEYALWQAAYLFISPQKVYRNFQYRKCSRDQWARDDPAFLVILIISLICTSIGFSLVMKFHFIQTIQFISWVVFIDCLGVGLFIATVLWAVSNHFMRESTNSSDPDVEWGYAFDIHLNAFFPLLITLHLLQLPFLSVIIANEWFFSVALGNLFWLVALLYYNYITFLGYRALPFLHNTKALFYPMTLMVLLYILSIIFRWNLTRKIYH